MTDFTDIHRAKCPYCKTLFIVEEGPLCDCLMEVQEVKAEMERQRQEEEPDEDEPLFQFRYRRNIRGYR